VAGTEHATEHDDRASAPSSLRGAPEAETPGSQPWLLGLQQTAGNAAVGKLLGAKRPVVQRQGGSAIAGTLEARAQQQIEAARAARSHGDGDEQSEDQAPPSAEEVAAEKARQRQAMSGAVSPPDTTGAQSETRTAADAAKTEAHAPAEPVAGGASAAAPKGTDSGAAGPTAAAGDAARLAAQAYALAGEQPVPTPTAPVEAPTTVFPVDAGGRPVPADPVAENHVGDLAGRVQALRSGAHQLRQRASDERSQSHQTQALVHAAESGISEAEAGVATLRSQTAYRREVTGNAKQALDVSKEKAQAVATGAPQVAAKSDEGKAKSGPIASQSQDLASENVSKQPDDAEAAGKSAEQGAKLTQAGSDAASIDDAIGQTKERASQLTDEAAQAQQMNTASEGKIAAADQALGQTEQKTAEMAGQNEAARAQLAALADGPAAQLAGAAELEAQADSLDAASVQLEARLHGAQQKYAAGMASIPARKPAGRGPNVQRRGYEGRERVDLGTNEWPPWLTGEDPPSAAERAEAQKREEDLRRQELVDIETGSGGHFEQLSAAQKAGIALRAAGRNLFSSVGNTNFPHFLGNMARGFIDPRASMMGIVNGLGMIASGEANLFSAAQWKQDPLGNLLKSTADIATGLTIVFGSIAGLATAIAVILTAIAIVGSIFSFGAVGAALAPIIAFCGSVAATVGPMALEIAAVALVLHGLVFIKNLIDAATATTANELQADTDRMNEDASNAGAMAMQIGMAKAMEAGGRIFAGGEPVVGVEAAPEGAVPAESGTAPAPDSVPATDAAPAPDSVPATDAAPAPDAVPATDAAPTSAPESGPAAEPTVSDAAPANDNAVPGSTDVPGGPDATPANDNAVPGSTDVPGGADAAPANDNAMPGSTDVPGGPDAAPANDNAMPANEPVAKAVNAPDPVPPGPAKPQLEVIEGGGGSSGPTGVAGEGPVASAGGEGGGGSKPPTVEPPTTGPSETGPVGGGADHGPSTAEPTGGAGETVEPTVDESTGGGADETVEPTVDESGGENDAPESGARERSGASEGEIEDWGSDFDETTEGEGADEAGNTEKPTETPEEELKRLIDTQPDELGSEVIDIDDAERAGLPVDETGVSGEGEGADPNLDEPNSMDELDRVNDDRRYGPEKPHGPAAARGEWSGTPYESDFIPERAADMGLEEGQRIPYRDGGADFGEFVVDTPGGQPGTIEVDGLTGKSGDFDLIDRYLAEESGMTPEQVKQWRQDNGLTYHHYGGRQIQIVPQRIHSSVPHSGSASELR
jgi:hypothetical protein